MPIIFGYAASILFIYAIIVFIIAQLKKDYTVIHIMWGSGIAFVSGFLFFYIVYTGEALSIAQRFAFYLPLVWGLRLTYFLFKRYKKRGTDYRFEPLHNNSRDTSKIGIFIKLFIGTALLQFLSAFSLLAIFAFPRETLTSTTQIGLIIGIVLWIIAFVYQVVADQQMRNFKHRPEMQGRILKTGLWKNTRHPNYVGEIMMWWSLYIIALTNVAPPFNFIAIIAPITVTVLIGFVSGVPLVEKKLQTNDEYIAYMKQTSKLIPLPRKK